eukprot:TRINITY_DN167_c0_g1_i1.p2 TRINITY_DN167_c0_g1~~TRINITY_DN167_c0_g1_i1.p2  ORF type:complete len:106 (-),score=12.40 TRINITY_DN167_c0_g1_i1:93-410(-)
MSSSSSRSPSSIVDVDCCVSTGAVPGVHVATSWTARTVSERRRAVWSRTYTGTSDLNGRNALPSAAVSTGGGGGAVAQTYTHMQRSEPGVLSKGQKQKGHAAATR